MSFPKVAFGFTSGGFYLGRGLLSSDPCYISSVYSLIYSVKMKSNVLPCDNDQRLCVAQIVRQQNFEASC